MAVLKTAVRLAHRGFESLPLRSACFACLPGMQVSSASAVDNVRYVAKVYAFSLKNLGEQIYSIILCGFEYALMLRPNKLT